MKCAVESVEWKVIREHVCRRDGRHFHYHVARFVQGGSWTHRVRPDLAVNMFGTKTILLIAVAGFLYGRPDWLDIALVCVAW